MKDDALKLALEALEEATTYTSSPSWSPSMTEECNKAITAIKQALAAPVQEPVAWMTQARCFVDVSEFTEAEAKLYGWNAVYTSPPAQQEPLGEEWIAHCWRKSIIGTRIHYVDYLALVRETERAHGIKENK
jgi:hypothetical protein